MRLAASRTFWTAGSKRPMRTAMMAITTSSSISVKPERLRGESMIHPPRGTAVNVGLGRPSHADRRKTSQPYWLEKQLVIVQPGNDRRKRKARKYNCYG